MMTTLRQVGLSLTAAAALIVLATGSSSAAPVINFNTELFTFTSDGCSGGCNPSGTITVTANGNDLTFAVSLGSNLEFLGGNGNGIDKSFAFDLGGVGSINILSTGLTAAFSTDAGTETAGTVKMDGEGTYNYFAECNVCTPSSPDGNSLTFTIDSGSLTGLQLLTDLTAESADGGFFAADVLNKSNGNTGVIDATLTATSTTPLPGALGLFGSVLLGGLGVAKWRKRRAGPVSVIS